ncbi:putative sialic acid transporter [Metallosphaera sp. J1]|uniref:MFS transporter n=1 Tax=Metallosphaera javensis (ex Hofmann et al. 2022) TaxID=99938 RepID=UPI001EDEEBF2|nr:MFS transporter [Metallosphaera javensis (ex Hofmann et al. 2022)]MCG3109572.1 putative sialic acid transporter [Metallosphaera javensis (ex Hofmann et al. 2022)]
MKDLFKPLDEKKLSFFHFKSLITTGMGVFTDGYDLSSIGIVLLLVLSEFGVTSKSPDYVSITAGISGSALAGAAVGAIIFGILSNQGRKKFYGIDVGLMTLGALLQAFVTDPTQLIIVRFLLGLGVGADYVLSPMIMAEHANAKDRGKIIALGFGLFWGFGATTAAILYLALQAAGVPPSLIWRIVLAAGAIPSASVIYLRRKIPETARFLGRIKGDVEGVKDVIREVTGTEVNLSSKIKDETSFTQYIKRNLGLFISAIILWFLFDIVAYSGILFGPSIIANSLGINSGVFQLLIEGGFTVPGGIIALSLIDRVGRKPLQVIGFVVMAISLVSFAFYKSYAGATFSPVLAFFLYGLQNLGSQAGPGSVSASGILGVELAPTKVRGLVQSLTVAGGRIGATLTSFVFPSLFQHYGESFAVYFLATIAAVAAVITFVAIPETKGKPLEESSNEVVISS